MSSSAVKLGPLTTTFTPPPECSSVFLYYDSVLGVNGYWGEECVSDDVKASAETGIYASSCYPEGWAGPFATNYRGHPDELAVFSPGLYCPRGWTSACSVERSANDDGPTDTQSAMWSILKAGETGIGCCPTGYSCATLSNLDYQCTKTVSPGDKVSGNSITGDECDIKQITVTIEEDFINNNLYAPQLNLIQGPSSETKDADSGGGDSGDDEGSSSSRSNGEGGQRGLSRNAIIAIGICIPLFAIAVGVSTFFIVRRKKRPSQPNETMVLNDPTMKPELDGNWGLSPSRATGLAWAKPEMDTGTTVGAVYASPSELRGSEISPPSQHHYHGGFTTGVHELRGSDYVPPELAADGKK